MTARLVAIMGSGETSPTMVKTHRALLARLGPAPVPAALLDTPFGFQSNADDIVARAVRYFRQSVGQELTAASFRSAAPDALEHQTMLRRLEEARYVFAGPGSPSYALRLWKASPVPGVLADKLRSGGCLTFASAAALTLGAATVPVYEIYKVGQDPHWLEGLDLLAGAGLPGVAVVPHFNNAEGGTHDTRFCYLGEERLSRMEAQLPTGSFVLGVDEHTALVLDLDEGTASVGGMGVVTVRSSGRSTEIPAGETLATSELAAMGGGGPGPVHGAPRSGGTGSPAGVATEPRVPPAPAPAPLADAVEAHRSAFDAALAGGDVSGAVRTTLELDEDLAAWAADTTQSDEMDRARSALRSLIARLGETGSAAASDPTETVAPFVELLLQARARARAEGRWTDADAVRDGLVALGVEVQDGPEGTAWRLLS